METTLRILIIEDSEDDCLLVLCQIKKGSYNFEFERVDTAKGMRDALVEKTWDIILSDYKMPHFNGIEALTILKESNLDIPFIIVSGTIGEDVAVQAMKAGANDYIMKNNLQRLLPAIERELHEVEQRAEKRMLEQKQKIAEETLKNSEGQYRTLLENVPVGIGVTDLSGNLITFNNAMLKPGGYSREDILQIGNVENLYYNLSDREAVISLMRENGFVNQYPVKFKRKDGTPYDALLSLSMIQFRSQPGIQALVEDITERKQAEEALRESEERFRRLFEVSPEAIMLIDPFNTNVDWPIVDCNEIACKMNGYLREELIGKSINFVNRTKGTPEERAGYLNSLRTNRILHIETYHHHRNGHVFPVEVTTSMVTFQGRELIMGIDRDITERKQAEEEIKQKTNQLQKLNAEKDLLFSIIAHDLKSPFNVVLGFSDLLVERANENDLDEVSRYAKFIKQSAERVMELLETLMDWSRSQTGRINFKPEYFELSELIDQIALLFKDIVDQKALIITNEVEPNTSVYADKIMIGTVLRNLVSNAIKYTKPNGKITISTSINQAEINILVQDTGVGMSREAIEKLFQFDNICSTPGTQNEKGTGLGLVICKELIEKHDGKIWVESEEENPVTGKNGNTTFYITIPNNIKELPT